MILLDTNALIWLDQRNPRARKLPSRGLYISPANLLELQFLLESGRIAMRLASVAEIVHRQRWLLDDPPGAAWFDAALGVTWTRDPFDRLLVAHARLRGWRLATADSRLLEQLAERERLAI